MYTLKKTKGYSLVEVLVATSILLIATLGPMTIAHKGLQTSRYNVERAIATFMAQEGIEAVVAARNNSIIAAINAGDLSQSWNWTETGTNPGVNRCFTATGCNMGFGSRLVDNNIINCNPRSNCVMYFGETYAIPFAEVNAAARSATKYMRVITLDEVATDQEVQITSTVYWDSPLTGGTDLEEVALHSAVFNIYE